MTDYFPKRTVESLCQSGRLIGIIANTTLEIPDVFNYFNSNSLITVEGFNLLSADE